MATHVRLSCGPDLPPSRMKDFYNIYARNPTEFRIVAGHRALLCNIASECNKLSPAQFASSAARIIVVAPTAVTTPIDALTPSTTAQKSTKQTDVAARTAKKPKDAAATDEELRTILNRTLSVQFRNDIETLRVVNVSAQDESAECNICNMPVKVSLRMRGSKLSWIISNFIRHTRKHLYNAASLQSVENVNGRKMMQTTLPFKSRMANN